ncbi:MAG: hypothetical protein IJS59_09165 [Bacteroidaceae bacterium]|nr:hypothetical protein [Bacteroidaceae bacterium]
MKKTVAIMALAVLAAAATIGSCGKDEELTPNPTPEQPEPAADPMPAGTYSGWTLGSNEYAAFIPSDGDALTISFPYADDALCDITYTSETWGTATIKKVAYASTDAGFTFAKPITATLRDDRSQWDFSAPVDSIAMPNRNPQGGTATVGHYPIVLTGGTMSTDRQTWQFDFVAYLVPRSAHMQNMSFRSGTIQRPEQ